MKKVIYDRTLSAVLRNNMANALNNQAVVDVDLANMFAAMAENADEDMVWREYAAQHLGTAIATSKDPSVGAAVLWQLADKGEGPIPGTALLHLHYLDRRHTVSAPDDFAKRLASVAVDPQAHLLTRMSALGIIGQRKLVELAPVVREIAQSDVPALQRSALATLGIIGIRADLEVILRHANDQDPTVSRAARAAAQRLTASIKAQENSNVPSRL